MSKPQELPRRALGRGLNTLLPARPQAPSTAPTPAVEENITHLRIDQIDPNPVQPRRIFQTEALEQLAQSIRLHGIIQPLVVRHHGARYQLVAGERRWRAARLAELREVPAVVQDISDDRLLEITLIENVQREDLNPIELAVAFDRMARELDLSHDEIGRRTSKDRSTVANAIRLLQLPPDVQQLVAERRLSAGHARCLLSLPDEEMRRRIAEKVVAQGLSVRQLERLTKRMTESRMRPMPRMPSTRMSKPRSKRWSACSAPKFGLSRKPATRAGSRSITTRPMTWTESIPRL